MKKLIGVSVVAGLLVASSGLMAAEDNGFYAGIGTGRLDFDFDDATFRTSTGAMVSGSSLNLDIESGTPLRLSAGYNWGGFTVNYAELSALLQRGGYDLYQDPKLKLLFDWPLNILAIGKYTPDIGETHPPHSSGSRRHPP